MLPIWTEDNFKEYLIEIKTHNMWLTDEQKEWCLIWWKFFTLLIKPSIDWYIEWYMDNYI